MDLLDPNDEETLLTCELLAKKEEFMAVKTLELLHLINDASRLIGVPAQRLLLLWSTDIQMYRTIESLKWFKPSEFLKREVGNREYRLNDDGEVI